MTPGRAFWIWGLAPGYGLLICASKQRILQLRYNVCEQDGPADILVNSKYPQAEVQGIDITLMQPAQ
jgi:hypothetical protein